MDRSSYLKSPKGAFSRYMYRQYNRTIRLSFEGIEPASKTQMRETDRLALQRQLIEQMAKLRRSSFRGPIVLELIIMTTKRNSASPQAIAKNLLDLFGPPEPRLKSKRRGLLYYDDSQVQGLTVSRWIGGSPRIDVTAMPMQSFAEDLKLAERARRETTDEVVRGLDYLEDSPSLHLAGEVGYIEELRRLTEHEAAFRNTFGRAYPAHLHFVRRKAQACLLRRSRPSIQLLSGVLSGWAQESEKGVLSWYLSRQLEDLLRHTCQIQLGELPTGAGTKKAYKKAVTEAVRDFQERYAWILNPLLFPVAVEIFIKPPPPHKGNHLHDLDNILLEYIVPSVLTTFQPSEPLHLDSVTPTNRLASGRGTVFGYTRPTARSGMAGITRLEAWRLHRDVNDKTEGYVNLSLVQDDSGLHGLLRSMRDVIDHWAKQNEMSPW